jgi:hypothetical protein
VDFTLREDITLQHYSNGDCNGSCDATAPRGEVSQLSLTGHPPSFRGKVTAHSDRHPDMLTVVSLAVL